MATKTETQINEFKINYLTEEQYQTALANNEINDDEIYMTPGNGSENTNVTYSLSKSGNTITLTGSNGDTSSVTYNEATTSSSGLMSSSDKVKLNAIDTVSFDNAGYHNCIYRGKSLGTSVTTAQYAEISAGTFKDMYIGDYWTINGIVYRIAAFDYYIGTGYGNTTCTNHHVTLVPDTCLYTHVMNDTDTTVGAFKSSKMYTTGLNSALNTINSAFGSNHVLNIRRLVSGTADNGYVTAYGIGDVKVTLMTECNVVGHIVYSNMLHGETHPEHEYYDGVQYPLFRYRPDLVCIGAEYWLRDVASTTEFSYVWKYGNNIVATEASNEYGVRPSFSIY